MEEKFCWWQSGIIYQIYPRSYQDSNNDGIGDLNGITSRLDYIKSLGVKTIWLSPMYPSPMYDFGYDVADYTDIHPIFGTMDDFDRLLDEIHKRDMKLVLDLVPNHSSSEHPWFKDSKSSKDNPKRNWYIWKDPAPEGGPPNNWLSYFGGSAWEYDEISGQYYLHLFAKQQPDLNYRNSEVRQAMLDVMKFWLDKGIDGFRVDVIVCLGKDELFRDEPDDPDWDGRVPFMQHKHIYTLNLPLSHDIARNMRTLIDKYDNRVLIGETFVPYDQLIQYYGQNNDECHMPFNFHLMDSDWDSVIIQKLVDDYEAMLPKGCWPNYVLSNHDRIRLASRVGQAQAKVAIMLLLTLRGTPTVYYGEEIGMHNGVIPPEFIQDPQAVNQPEIADEVGRDPERTPMQWDGSSNAGFSSKGVVTWLPVAEDYNLRNVINQEKSDTSDLALFKKLTGLRTQESALIRGDYKSVKAGEANIYAYLRMSSGDKKNYLIVLNFSSDQFTLNLSHIVLEGCIAVSTLMDRNERVDLSNLIIRGDEGLVIEFIPEVF